MAAFQSLEEMMGAYEHRAADAARALCKRAVRPIYSSTDGKRFAPLGSAVLVEFAGAPCVVTAAHVLDENEHAGLYLGGHPELIALNLRSSRTNKVDASRAKDLVDVGAIILPPEIAAKVSHLGFIKAEHQLEAPVDGDARVYLVMGYRRSQNKKASTIAKGELPLKIWTCRTGRSLKGGSQPLLGPFNFALDYPKDMQRSPTELVVTTPPEGVSGGGIFDLGDLANVATLASETLPPPKLVGILVACRDNTLIGTELSAARAAFEDLEA